MQNISFYFFYKKYTKYNICLILYEAHAKMRLDVQ